VGSFLNSVDGLVSIPHAAERLKLKQEVLYHLINRGLVQIIKARIGRRSARFLTEQEITKFTEQIEPLALAAARHGVSKQRAHHWAVAYGLEIISGPSVDGGRQYFLKKPLPHKLKCEQAGVNHPQDEISRR